MTSNRQILNMADLQRKGDRRINTTTPTTAPWRALILITMLLPGANGDRFIESSKSVTMTTTAATLALFSTIVSVLAMCFVIVYRKNKIVSVGQPFFLCVICFGSLLLSVSLYFEAGMIENIPNISWKVLDKLCVLQFWCLYCGILIVLVAIICKLWRAEKVFQFRKGQKILVRHVLWPMIMILVAEFALLITATFVSPPSWGEVLMDPFDKEMNSNITLVDSTDKMPTCFASPDPAEVALQISSHILILVALIVVLWMAYLTRGIPEEVVDTKRVYYLTVCHFLLYVPYLLLEYGVIPSGRAYHYFCIWFPFLVSITSVGFSVFPKVYFVFYQKRHGRLPKSATSVISTGAVHVSGIRSSNGPSKSSIYSSKQISHDTTRETSSSHPSHSFTSEESSTMMSTSGQNLVIRPSNASIIWIRGSDEEESSESSTEI